MRIHLFDPQVNRFDGHYAAYDAAIIAEVTRRGFDTALYGNIRQTSSISATLHIEPVFRRGMFEEVATDPLVWGLENFVQLGREFAEDLGGLGIERFHDDDLAFFPNIIQYQIDGVRQWLSALPSGRRPKAVLKLSYLTHAMPYLQLRANKEIIPLLYRFAMRRLVADHPRTRICTDTEEMARQFSLIAGVPVELVPLPLSFDAVSPTSHNGSPLRVAYLGHASPLKGFHILPEVITRIVASKDPVHFLVQCYGDGQLCADLESACSRVPAESLSLIRGAVEADRYRELLASSDIILLPYAREFYGWASSGIFAEAMSGAKVVITTEGTWPAAQLARFGGGGITVKNVNGEAIAEAIRRAARGFSELKRRATKAVSAWKSYHSASALVDRLLAIPA